ncbi:MAG: hypothetical protein GY940_39465 [bacterium]|nr:hypothetical protein [bacterium]
MKYVLVLLLSLLMLGCGSGEKGTGDGTRETVKKRAETGNEGEPAAKNIFHDKVLQTIYTLQNRRDAEGLKPYFSHQNPGYRKAAATAFASVQDAAGVEPLAALLTDPVEAVRSAAAYALGQTRDNTAEPLLIKAYGNETSVPVKRDILEAIGKCGTKKGLTFITGLDLKGENPSSELFIGQAWGIYRFALNTVVSVEGTALAVRLLAADKPGKARFIASHYLGRTRGIDLKDWHGQLKTAFEKEKEVFARMALASAMGKAKVPGMAEYLKSIISSAVDYRVKVNALRSLGRFDYNDVKDIFFQMISDKNTHLSVAASEYFLANGIDADAKQYFDTAKNLLNWRSRANMLNAALKFTPAAETANRKKINDWILAAYKKTAAIYEKAWLLNGLAGDLGNYMFVRSVTFDNVEKEPVIAGYGINSLATMFQTAKTAGKTDKETLDSFAGDFKKAILSGDISMIAVSAGLLQDPKMEFKTLFKDTSFLTTALNKCQLPRDAEAQQLLQQTINFFDGKKSSDAAPPQGNRAIDWQLVLATAPGHRVRIKTGKGDITIQLLINQSPGSVSNFLRLVRENFYQTSVFHRVVPNFVIQDGCPRGDGWGGPPYSIGSEFGPLYYGEGFVGMASSGKDTEGSQWFITHSPTPHLDGRYTIFGKVVSGMDVVHKIEVGDKVLGVEEL